MIRIWVTALIVGAAGAIDDGFVVSGYLPDYRFYINLNQTVLALTDVIAFSMDTEFNCCLNNDHFRILAEAKAYRELMLPDAAPIKLWLSVGGAGRSDGFSALFGNKPNTEAFLKKLLAFTKKNDFDGVDFDCELPFRDQNAYKEYMRFLYQASISLHSHGILVSVALHPGQNLARNVGIDRVHLMAYDMIDRSSQGQHHAQLKKAHAAVEFLKKTQAPRSIVLGIPAYGRDKTNPGITKTFAELVDERDGWIVDQLNEIDSVAFDSPREVREKVKYAEQNELLGVFIWELGQDKQVEEAPAGVILEAINGKDYKKEDTEL